MRELRAQRAGRFHEGLSRREEGGSRAQKGLSEADSVPLMGVRDKSVSGRHSWECLSPVAGRARARGAG